MTTSRRRHSIRPVRRPGRRLAVLPAVLLAGLMLMGAGPAHAMLYWRISVKVFQSSSGTPPRPADDPNYDTLQEVRNLFDLMNRNFDRLGWGVRFQLRELLTINSDEWFNKAARDSGNRTQLELLAKVQGQFRYQPDSINVYINNTKSGISGGHLPLLGDVVLMGIGGDAAGVTNIPLANRFWAATLQHEVFHSMGLPHTQGRFCNGCPPDSLGACDQPGDDGLGDTLLDVACWTTDDIARRNFGGSYAVLSTAQKAQVDRAFMNIMSYHNQTLDVITHDQWDLMIDTANLEKRNVATGSTIFVDRGNGCLRPEDLSEPFRSLAQLVPGWSWGMRAGLGTTLTAPICPPPPLPCSMTVCLGGPFKKVGDAVNSANSGDRLHIKAGNYNESVRINRALTLATDRGTVVIGRP